MTDAAVWLWGTRVGAVSWDERRSLGVFQFEPAFVPSGIQIAPLTMPLRESPYEFPALRRESFYGLPGLVADSLPDRFGNRLIDEWCARTGRDPERFNPVQRLCYIANRGMGALEFEPTIAGAPSSERTLEVAELVELARAVLGERQALAGSLDGRDDRAAIEDILRVGTSAGGARAKAVLAYNEATGEFRSGQVSADEGFTYWLIKFDGVSGEGDRDVAESQGYGAIEYAYALMAQAAGLEMARCRLHIEGSRRHFMTRRFDRTESGQKLHMTTLAGLAHFDFNDAGAHSYEQGVQVMRRLHLGVDQLEQLVLRAYFNVAARNHDDHVKNIAFLMDRSGQWRLSPAYDIAYAYNPRGFWTHQHQMRVNGKADGFTTDDLLALAHMAGVKQPRATALLARVSAALARWRDFAAEAGVPEDRAAQIQTTFRVF